MKFKLPILVFVFSIFACSPNEDLVLNSENIKALNASITHDYRIKKYVTSNREKTLVNIDYILNNQLVEQLGKASRKQLIYNNGRLEKIIQCRFNNCNSPYYELLNYDDNGNLLGSSMINTKESGDIETLINEQTKYYNADNVLVKERVDKGSDVNSNPFETWKTYTYKANRIATEIQVRNQDTIWIGTYSYDQDNRLKKISRTNDTLFDNDTFTYNSKGLLVKKTRESNVHKIAKNTSFSVHNTTTVYVYNDANKCISETIYNHLGQTHLEFNYQIEKNNYN
nr:hypothetical protein [uncultured Psychroserpens sp.]